MSHHSSDEEHHHDQDQPASVQDQDDGRGTDDDSLSRPQEILREAANEEGITDEEAVLAYNANAESAPEETGMTDKK
jgi:hypothetical protein